MTKPIYITSDLALRFLNNDHPEKSRAAKEFFEAAKNAGHPLVVSAGVAGELLKTLAQLNGVARAAQIVKDFLNAGGMQPENEPVMLAALGAMNGMRSDWTREWALASAMLKEGGLAEFEDNKVAIRKTAAN